MLVKGVPDSYVQMNQARITPNPLIMTVTGGFPSQSASNADFDVLFVVGLNKLLNKQSGCSSIQYGSRQGAVLILGRVHENKRLWITWIQNFVKTSTSQTVQL